MTTPTPDEQALTEQIARALRLAETGDTLPPGFAARMWDSGEANREKYLRQARAVLPIVKAAQRDAARGALDGLVEQHEHDAYIRAYPEQAFTEQETRPVQGGPWTSHGHPVPGITVYGPGRPKVARCGGPALCSVCQRDRARIEQETQP